MIERKGSEMIWDAIKSEETGVESKPLFEVYKDGVWEEKDLEVAYRVGNNFIYKFTDKEGYLWTVATDQDGNITDVSRQ